MQGCVRAAALIATAAALAVPAVATAAFPGSNGRIFFDVGGGSGAAIFSIDPDGSGRERLVDKGREPAVSADGRRIAYMRGGDLFTAGRAGNDEQRVTDTDAVERTPSFAPGGNKLVFATQGSGGRPGHIFTIRVDGTDRTPITQSERSDSEPQYSPDGNKIVFVRTGSNAVPQLFKIDADGSNRDQLTSGELACEAPTWSPDGNRIAFEGFDGSSSIYTMHPNSTGLLQLTDSELGDHEPAYSPSGNKIVLRGTRDDSKGLFVVGAEGGSVERLTSRSPSPGVGVDANPFWGPTP